MLTISIDNDGRLVATQRDSSPTVYLDHWALRELSTTPLLAKQRNGTLALSCTNLIGLPRPPHEDRELFSTLVRLKPQSVSAFTAAMRWRRCKLASGGIWRNCW